MVLMSGGAAVIVWVTSAEAFSRRSGNALLRRLGYACVISILILSGVIAIVLDGSHGEGTVTIAYPVFFIPILVSSYYLLRQFALLLDWNPVRVVSLCFGFVALHAAAQLIMNLQARGLNQRIIFVWLAIVGAARSGLFVGVFALV
jgi:hypothetical protein